GRPNDVHPDWLFFLAQARHSAGRFERAAEAAERYVATNAPEWREQAARLAVTARERALAAAGLRARDEPPAAEGSPPAVRAVEIPAPLRGLIAARERLAEILAD